MGRSIAALATVVESPAHVISALNAPPTPLGPPPLRVTGPRAGGQAQTSNPVCQVTCPATTHMIFHPQAGSMDRGEGSMAERVTPRSEDYSRWYTDVVQKAELADYSPVKGCMVIRPYGYTLWENVQAALDRRFKGTGHVQARTSALHPDELPQEGGRARQGLRAGAGRSHARRGKGWTSRWWCSRPRDDHRLHVQPMDSLVCDLPVLINQWANVVRWEMPAPGLFLRDRVPVAGRPHRTCATEQEAVEETLRMLDVCGFAISKPRSR